MADKANIQLKIAMQTVSHLCRCYREFILRIDKAYHNLLSMQRKLQDLFQPTLTTADIEKSTICSKSPGRQQQHLQLPRKIVEYERSKRTLTPVHDSESKSKKPMRLLLPKPAKRSLPLTTDQDGAVSSNKTHHNPKSSSSK